jgi:hypothetical protein
MRFISPMEPIYVYTFHIVSELETLGFPYLPWLIILTVMPVYFINFPTRRNGLSILDRIFPTYPPVAPTLHTCSPDVTS